MTIGRILRITLYSIVWVSFCSTAAALVVNSTIRADIIEPESWVSIIGILGLFGIFRGVPIIKMHENWRFHVTLMAVLAGSIYVAAAAYSTSDIFSLLFGTSAPIWAIGFALFMFIWAVLVGILEGFVSQESLEGSRL